MVKLENLCLDFLNQKIFDNVNLSACEDDRIGLVGRNGSGKSTLLKVVTKLNALDSGRITISNNFKVAYMPQEVVMNSERSIFDEVMDGHLASSKLLKRLAELEKNINSGTPQEIEEYGDLLLKIEELNVDIIRRKAKDILIGLGFKEETLSSPVSNLSVGWQMRVILAKLLIQEADFYLFDEPTNHLDIVAKDWFLDFLKNSNFGFLLVCHDRYFLDQLCDKIFELELGKGTLYNGNYEKYETEKARNLEALRSAYQLQQKDIKEKKETIERFRAKASKAKMAKSMERSLDKIELIELPPQTRSVNFNFNNTKRAGRIVLDVKNLSYKFGDKQIFKNVSFQVERGEKVALVAPNGCGKTTLLNVIMGKYPIQSGTIEFGYSVDSVIFEQEQHKVLSPEKTVYQEVCDAVANKTEQAIRTFMGSFLFGKDEIAKKIKVLSGGERNRVSMVKVLLQDANFLILDEPTNHLDIQSKEILLSALNQFDGTILFVSHDQDFVNKLATRVLELNANGIESYLGNYDSFLNHKKHLENFIQKKTNSNNTNGELKIIDTKKDLSKIERSISRLESDIKKLTLKFADLEYGTDEFDKCNDQLQAMQKELEVAIVEWEKLQKG